MPPWKSNTWAGAPGTAARRGGLIGACGPAKACRPPQVPLDVSFPRRYDRRLGTLGGNHMAVACRMVGAIALALSLTPVAFAQVEADLLQQQEKQRQIRAETDQVVRRMTTMLRVMNFYGADKDAEAD